jgi:urease accessory protein
LPASARLDEVTRFIEHARYDEHRRGLARAACIGENMKNPQSPVRSRRTIAVPLLLFLPLAAFAHPGHGETGFLPGALHAWHGLDHALAAIAVGVWGVRIGGRARWALPFAFVAAMALGMALQAAGAHLPFVEPAIAASLLLLGAAIAGDTRIPVMPGVLLVAAFAPFHGAAHAAALDVGGALPGFAFGLLLATAALHAAGTAAAAALRARTLWLRIAAAPLALLGMGLLALRLG